MWLLSRYDSDLRPSLSVDKIRLISSSQALANRMSPEGIKNKFLYPEVSEVPGSQGNRKRKLRCSSCGLCWVPLSSPAPQLKGEVSAEQQRFLFQMPTLLFKGTSVPTRSLQMALVLVTVLISAIPAASCYSTTFQDLPLTGRNRTSIKFLAIGDWGGLPYPPYTTVVQRTTAQEMSNTAERMGADFIVALGDNFYYKGVRSVDSSRFKQTFEDVYTQKSLMVPWYVLAGNHDHAGSVKAQMEYSQISDRWNFPAYYYELNFRIPNTEKTLTILMLDTVKLCGNSNDFSDEKPRGPLSALEANRQLTWLQERLDRSEADFLLVAGHYPVWSVSHHGPTACLLQKLRPLLIKHKATAYLCGHDHNLQYIKESSVGYVVSGAGNFMDPSKHHWHEVPKGTVKFFTGQMSTLGGFVHAEVTQKEMILTFIQAKGTSLYRTVLKDRNSD